MKKKIIKILKKHSERMKDSFEVSCTIIEETEFENIAIEIEHLLK